jgi:peptide/nickel transport system substrate-binding protein
MVYNVKRPPLDKIEVRQALAYAVNYDAIRKVALQGQARSAQSSPIPPTLSFWSDPNIAEYGFNPDKARELLAKAGFTAKTRNGLIEGLSFGIIYDQADPYVSNWVQIVRDTSREAGIDIKLTGMERNTWIARANAHDFDIYAGSWAVMENPPSNLDLAYRTGGFINYGEVSDPEVDALLLKSVKALKAEDQRDAIRQVARIVRDKMYDNVLYVQDFNIAYNAKRWTGFVEQPSDLLSIVNPLSLSSVKPS